MPTKLIPNCLTLLWISGQACQKEMPTAQSHSPLSWHCSLSNYQCEGQGMNKHWRDKVEQNRLDFKSTLTAVERYTIMLWWVLHFFKLIYVTLISEFLIGKLARGYTQGIELPNQYKYIIYCIRLPVRHSSQRQYRKWAKYFSITSFFLKFNLNAIKEYCHSQCILSNNFSNMLCLHKFL